MDARRIEEIRRANFPTARRGYDRDAVDDFLDRLATSLESEETPAAVEPGGAVKREIAKLGERTAGILSAAEEAASKVRDDAAKREVEAKETAEELTRRARIDSQESSQKLVAEAEKKAEQIIDEAVARRRRLNQAITSLAERRDEIAAETTRLATDLSAAVGRLTEFDEPAANASVSTGGSAVVADDEDPHPPEAQAAVPDVPQAATGPAKAPPPPPQESSEPALAEEPDSLEQPFEPDSDEFEPDSEVYEEIEDDGPREIQLLVDPEEDETALIDPGASRSKALGPDPTEEATLPRDDAGDEEDEDSKEESPPSEDATAIQKAIDSDDDAGSQHRKR